MPTLLKVQICLPLLWFSAHCLCGSAADTNSAGEARFLSNIRQLTFEGRRGGEGYFSTDGKALLLEMPEAQFERLEELARDEWPGR